jgi:hypothetical protein
MSTEHVLDDGIKSIKDAWQREHTARFNLEMMLENTEAENAKLRELIGMIGNVCDGTSEVCEYCKNYSATNDECMMLKQMQELGIEV